VPAHLDLNIEISWKEIHTSTCPPKDHILEGEGRRVRPVEREGGEAGKRAVFLARIFKI
jgi:hypothetical protein